MSDWDGTDFRHVDDEGPGDGSGGGTQFLCTALEHAVRNQAMWTRKRDAGVSLVYGQPRRIASVDESAFYLGSVPVDKTVETIRVIVHALVGTDDGSPSTPEDYDIQTNLKLFGWGGVGVTTSLSSGTVVPIVHELDVSARFERPRWQKLMLTVQSGIGPAFGGDDIYEIEGNGAIDAGALRADRGVALRYLAQGVYLDQVYGESDPDTIENVAMAPAYAAAGSYDAARFEERYMSWLAVDSMTVEVDRDAESVQIDQSQIQAAIPYEAQWSSLRHARNQTSEYTRPRAVSLGAGEGGAWAGDGWSPLGWDTSTSVVWQDSAKLDLQSDTDADGVLTLRFDWMGVHAVAGYRGALRESDQDSALGAILEEAGGTADVAMTLTVEQLADGDTWSTATTVGTETKTWTESDLVPTDETGRWPLLQQIRWHRLDEQAATRTAEVFHERQVWTQDLELLRPDGLQVEIDESAWVPGRPVRVTLEATLSNVNLARVQGIQGVDQTTTDRAGVYVHPDASLWHGGR